jgi:hypothetical protein
MAADAHEWLGNRMERRILFPHVIPAKAGIQGPPVGIPAARGCGARSPARPSICHGLWGQAPQA